jgi:hypothetical protein
MPEEQVCVLCHSNCMRPSQGYGISPFQYHIQNEVLAILYLQKQQVLYPTVVGAHWNRSHDYSSSM